MLLSKRGSTVELGVQASNSRSLTVDRFLRTGSGEFVGFETMELGSAELAVQGSARSERSMPAPCFHAPK
jgi:hypothetical protein